MTILTNIPAQLQPFALPIAAIVVMVMGFAALVAFNNPGLKAAIKGHVFWLIGGLAAIVGGGVVLASFAKGLGL